MINIIKETTGCALKNMKSPFIINPSTYEIDGKYTGAGVKIAIIDSGCPDHKILKKPKESTSFCKNYKEHNDIFGHSSLVSGIISSQDKKNIMGIAPNADIYYAKAIDDKGNGSFNALIASVLWSVVKNVDIILLSLGTQTDYTLLHDAIKKSYHSNICVIAAAGNNIENKNIDYPSKYIESFAVGAKTKNKKYNEILKKECDIIIENTALYTTYLNNNYIKASGSSIAAALVSGITALIIEKNKSKKNKISVKNIFDELKELYI